MSLFISIIDASFREYADLLLRRHLLLGKENADAEVEELEARMNELWENLDSAQRQSLNGMGSDLNWVRRKGLPPPKPRSAGEVSSEEYVELLAARKTEDWHKVLHYLRVCAPIIPASELALLRGSAYQAIELMGIASAMLDLVADLEPISKK